VLWVNWIPCPIHLGFWEAKKKKCQHRTGIRGTHLKPQTETVQWCQTGRGELGSSGHVFSSSRLVAFLLYNEDYYFDRN
jgi:hypothetical protein